MLNLKKLYLLTFFMVLVISSESFSAVANILEKATFNDVVNVDLTGVIWRYRNKLPDSILSCSNLDKKYSIAQAQEIRIHLGIEFAKKNMIQMGNIFACPVTSTFGGMLILMTFAKDENDITYMYFQQPMQAYFSEVVSIVDRKHIVVRAFAGSVEFEYDGNRTPQTGE